MIKLIILDFNGVIVLESYPMIARQLAERHSLDSQHVYDVIYGYHNQAALGEIPEDDIFKKGLADLRIDEDWKEVEQQHYQNVAARNEPAIAYAQELRGKGIVVIGLSKNVPRAFSECVRLSHTAEEIDAIINTYDLGLEKSSPEVMERLMQLYGVSDPKQVIFVDDQEPNLDGARALGIHTHFYQSFDQMKLFIDVLL